MATLETAVKSLRIMNQVCRKRGK